MTDTALTPTGSKPSGFLGALQATFGPALWRAYIYGLVTAVLGMVVSIAVFVLTVTGASLIIVWIGLPIVLAALLVARAALNVDLVLQRRLLSADVQPVTLDLSGLSVLARLRILLRDRVTWSALVWSLLQLPVALGWLVLAVLYPLVPLTLIAAPFAHLAGQQIISVDDSSSWLVSSLPGAILLAVAGVVLLAAGAWLVRGVAAATAGLGTVAVGVRQQDLQASMQQLRRQRDSSLASAEHARRRIERDLHDGAQRHFTAAAMTLGRARRKMTETDPAAELVEQAAQHVIDGLEDLRRIVRRSGPASLEGRDLGAALRQLATGLDVPLTVDCEIDDAPPNVRTALYYVASEAVTNAAQHAQANSIEIRVRPIAGGRLQVTITDDGVGGAREHTGGGIEGLRDRVDALGGDLTIDSPEGGPTTLQVSLPCES